MCYAAKRVEQSLGYGYLSKMEWFVPNTSKVSKGEVLSEPAYPHSILMQESKDMREKNVEPEIYREVKSQIMDGVCWIMISNHPTDVMWQNRHIFSQQNRALMKI